MDGLAGEAEIVRQEVDSRARLVIVGVIVVALFTGLLTRLWFLQVTGGEKLAVEAQQQRGQEVSVPALRGAILDAKGRVLAETVLNTALMVDRQKLTAEQRSKLVFRLGLFLGVSTDEVEERLDSVQYAPYEPVPVSTALTFDQFVYISEHRSEFPATELAKTQTRVYHYGTVAAHALGYIGKISKDDREARPDEGYQLDDVIGKAGIERTFESELRGKPGVDTVQVDSRGEVTSTSVTRKPVAGHDVQLSIDIEAQQLAEESLQQGIELASTHVSPDSGNYYQPKGGSVVVLDARTGAVAAIASGPTFDPNDFINGDSDHYFADTVHYPLVDRALNPYPPGSSFKLFSSIATLKYGIKGANDSLYDRGYFVFGNEQDRRYNAGKVENGWVDLPLALTVSSDVYFYSAGNDFWNIYRDENGDAGTSHPVGYGLQDTAKAFGFNAPTGIELPEEKAGRIPDLAFNRTTNECSADGQPGVSGADTSSCTWRRGDSASLAVGQGDVLVTPLQLADGYAAFANGGKLYTPRLVQNVRASRAGLGPGEMGAVVRPTQPMVKNDTQLDPAARDAILSGLDGVVYSGRGTARAAFSAYDGPRIVGKTGTAQNQDRDDTSWFAAITNPENDPARPQYVIVAMVEEGGFGADVAAPIVRRVAEYLNGNPDPAPVQNVQQAGEKQD